MKIEIAEHARMSERGSSLLRLIQNNEMPVLDLLVRESIQNSLDAAQRKSSKVEVAFNSIEFENQKLNKHFDKITEGLNNKFPSSSSKLLEIRDTNTFGLTGPLHYTQVEDNNFGNLLKLVYEISMPQQKEGAGGSWGLGKTVYFRLGIGLVVYYSRIKNTDGNFESRLAACLVEDETKEDCLVKSSNSHLQRGIAWWGQSSFDGKSTMPITNEEEINEILSDLNIKPFNDYQTGTSIIIPYIDEKKILEETLDSDQRNRDLNGWWTSNIQDYLNVSVQRWYAPRLANPTYEYGPYLDMTINGKEISNDNMLSLYKVIQELYNIAKVNLAEKKLKLDYLETAEVHVKEINLRNTFKKGQLSGKVAYVKLTKEDLRITPPNNLPSPLMQLLNSEVKHDFNPPIFAYTRRPGMIVNYEQAGYWTDGIPKTSTEEFLIAIFVPNSDNYLLSKSEVPEISFEEYIRKGEKADHTSWNDWNLEGYRLSIIAKIQQRVRKLISDTFKTNGHTESESKTTGLSRSLGQILLPPQDFGRLPVGPKSENGNSSSPPRQGINPKINLTEIEYLQNKEINIKFELIGSKKSKGYQVELKVPSESGVIGAAAWESDEVFGKAFPIEIIGYSFNNIVLKSGNSKENIEDILFQQKDYNNANILSVSKVYSEKYNICSAIEVKHHKEGILSGLGELRLRFTEDDFKAGVSIVKIVGDENA